jgi:hypothetical protein
MEILHGDRSQCYTHVEMFGDDENRVDLRPLSLSRKFIRYTEMWCFLPSCG